MAELVINNIKLLEKLCSKNSRVYYNTLCLNCNRESIRRLDQIKISKGYCNYCKDSNKKSSINSVIKNLYRSYKNSANQKSLFFNIDKETFKNTIESNCYYCGDKPIESLTSKLRNFTNTEYCHNGIDRIDSNIGYEQDNIVSCCSMCNYMKRNYIVNDFYNKINKIYKLRVEERISG